ncbi:sensor histidine kinase [Actinomadura hibisca]|uniref:sensor histidine kinase n=1 Tax=Actinomadura hibisca TaxID=68565 RepID=UPI00082B667D|nr:sensor histidine kinase [Actinomadura hibisca]
MTRAEQRIHQAMHAGFFLLLAASASRLVVRHGTDRQTWLELAACAVLAVLYALGIVQWDRLGHRGRLFWLATVVLLWLALVISAPSFAWCAIPLFFVSLRLLGRRAALVSVVVLTGAVIFAQVRLADRLEPSLVLGPVAVAGMTAVIFLELQGLIDDLVRTRDELAASQREAGVLEERQRLSREIHDTLAQGLSSMGILLQAADREWDADPQAARRHVRRAADAAADNLAEARRFVRALPPADLAAGSLPAALRGLLDRADGTGPPARLQVDGAEYDLDTAAQAALVRVVQGALANVREHAGASAVMVTLTYLDDQVRLDVADDGTGFDRARPGPGRGYGLTAMRERLAAAGGTLEIESVPGEGTVVAATVPRRGR